MVELVETASERCSGIREGGHDGAEAGTEEVVVRSGKEECDAQPGWGQSVAVAVRHALNQTVQAKPAELIRHSAGRELFRRDAQQRRQPGTKLTVGEAGRQQIKSQCRVAQGLHIAIAEAECGNTLLADL